jgi:hypothetical protein
METITDVVTPAKRRPKEPRTNNGHNGHADGINAPQSEDLALILESLQTMRDGNFSVRLPVAWTGLKGKIADTFNDIIAANERMASELTRSERKAAPENGRRFSSRAEPGARCKAPSIRWLRICCGQPTR